MAASALTLVLVLIVAVPLPAQPTATLQGHVFDVSGGVLRGATISVRGASTGFDRFVTTDDDGRYHIEEIPAGTYEVTVAANGFKSAVAAVIFDVARILVRDFRLEVGNTSETVVVRAATPLVDRASTGVGRVLTSQTVQEIPLNGRHFTDLALLAAGSVAPSQTGFSTTPIRGVGAIAINTAGNREEAAAFLINGVSANNLAFGSLGFEPPIASIQEFRVENSVFSSEYGHVSGAIVNMITRSGNNQFHGEAFEFLRNDAFDARNFFEFTSPDPHPFSRNQFGGSLGGRVIRDKAFFFASYQGLRQRQGLDLNSPVLSDDERLSVTDPVIRRLVGVIPQANVFDTDGTPRFVGSAAARVETDHGTGDVLLNLGRNDRFHAFYGTQRIRSWEPTAGGNSIPGFGSVARLPRSLLTLSETRIFTPTILNEVRFGQNRLSGSVVPAAELNPVEVGIQNGVTRPIGLPQLMVAGGLNFGGPSNFPASRDDISNVIADTLSLVSGRHAVRLGGEYRHFINENFAEGTGAFNFPTVAAFLSGTANAFNITLGERSSHIDQRAVAGFFQDRISIHRNVTLDLGLRYEWHVTPTERDHRFVVFDAATVSLQQVGVDIDNEIYRQNNRNVEPRVGVVWDVVGDGRTVLRGVYGRAVDEPGTTAVSGTAANPPFAQPLTAAGSIPLSSAIDRTQATALAPVTVDPRFRNASVQSWNVNVQRQLAGSVAAMIGYFGSQGNDLRISRNINQPIDGVRPFITLSSSSPILPGVPLGNITQVENSGFSSYHALWVSVTQRLSRGWQVDASYTWSKSLDTNSLNSSGFAVQDAYNIPDEYGLSDFDARHRFVLDTLYELPFDRHWLTRGWQIAAIIQAQSGNPVNIVTSNSTLNGLPNTVRPDLTGPIRIIGTVEQWFDPSVFVAVDRFGDLGRNVVIGPAFSTTDVSLIRNEKLGARARVQFRADVFDLFNHPNFGPPGNIVGSSTFGKISRTRFPTGEAGSSRQIQLALKFSF
ncbi:MAG TPA: TonB-dependent receptor [Vicinamibacterales bacterium]|jgi:hypothetical protein